MRFSCAVLILSDTVLIKTTSYLVDEEFKDEEKIKNGSFWNQQIYKRSVNKFAIFLTFLTLLQTNHNIHMDSSTDDNQLTDTNNPEDIHTHTNQ